LIFSSRSTTIDSVGVGQRHHVLVAAQLAEAIADGLRRHRLQPQALDRQLGVRVLRDQAEDQFTFAPRVTGVDQAGHILAFDEAREHLQARFGFGDRAQIKVRRDHRQMGEAPFAAFDFVFVGGSDFDQVANRRGEDVVVTLKVLVVLGEATQRARDISGDRRFFGNDEGLGHVSGSWRSQAIR
jgi:hypothetical protein